jgi:hypothetical protein
VKLVPRTYLIWLSVITPDESVRQFSLLDSLLFAKYSKGKPLKQLENGIWRKLGKYDE